MSRIGKKKIPLPDGVTATQKDSEVTIKGPKGVLTQTIHPLISLRVDSDGIQVEKKTEHRKADAFSGLVRSLVANMVKGVTEGYTRQMDIVGVGYRAEMSDKAIVFQLGYSHRVNFPLPEGISAEIPKPTQVIIKGIDNCLVGQTAANIRALRKPEPYKGKGIKYTEEIIRRKVGKAGVK